MDQKYKKITKEIQEALEERLKSAEFKGLFEAITKAEDDGQDTGTFKQIISTEGVDRSGEIVIQNGLDIKRYLTNPIVLWAHDYYKLPVGMTTKIYLEDGKWVAEGKFAPEEANPFAQQVRKLYEGKFINTASIGFIVKKMDGNKITESELLEWSFVPVPANSEALSLAKKLNFDLGELKTKGIILEEKKKHILKISELVVDSKNAKLIIKYTDGHSKTRDLTGTCLKGLNAVGLKNTDKQAQGLKEAVGAIMTTMQNELDEKIVAASQAILEAIASNVTDEKTDKNSDKPAAVVEDKGDGAEKAEKRSEAPEQIKELDQWYKDRDVLRALNTGIVKALENYNKIIKDKKSINK